MNRRLVPAVLLVLAAGCAAAEEWNHVIAPYAWGPSLDAKASVGAHEAEAEASASDLLEDMELAALVRYEGHSERWGVLVDVVHMGLGQGFPKTSAELDFDTSLLEVAGSWHATKRVELIFGARAVRLEGEAESDTLPDVAQSDAWVDAIAGVRVKLPLGRRWTWSSRADIGAGGSDDTWNVESGFAFAASDRVSIAAGWRVLAFDRDGGDVAMDGTLSGPEIGIAIKF